MKLGNTSQSIVPVPDFFFTRSIKNMETFKVNKKRGYFREKDLFKQAVDLNLCNNPRNNHRKFEDFNKTKYIPVHRLLTNYSETNQNTTISKFANLTSKPKPNSFENFQHYMARTDVTNFANPNLKEDIKNNIGNLLDRINNNFDLNKWSEYNSKPNFTIDTQPLSALTMYNMNHETEASKFKRTLTEKVKSLSFVEEEQKSKALRKLEAIESNDDKNFTMTIKNSTINSMTGLPSLFTTERSLMAEQLSKDNKNIYEKYKHTTLYQDFPSPNREEFINKRGEKISVKRKKQPDFTIDATKFNAYKHKAMFCEKHKINGGIMLKFENKTETFT